MKSPCWLALLGAAIAYSSLQAQPTRIDLQSQSRNVDFSAATATKPFKTGSSLPATCSQGEAYFKIDSGVLYGCLTANAWQPITGSGGMASSGMGAPAGPCTPGQSFYLDTTVTRGNLWYCNSNGVWLQVLDTTGVGSFVITGQTGTAPPAPPAGYGSAWFDTASGVWMTLSGSTTSSTVVPITCPAGQFIQSVSSSGVPTCVAAGPRFAQWFHAATCLSGSAAASGAWQMRSDQPLTASCNSLIDGNPEQAVLQFSNSTDQFLWLQVPVPTTWATGSANLKVVTYPASATGDARFGVQTKCIAAGAATSAAYNTEVFAVRGQATAFNPEMTLFSSLNLTGCSAGNLLVIQLRRQNTCTGCANGNMAAAELFLGASLEIQ